MNTTPLEIKYKRTVTFKGSIELDRLRGRTGLKRLELKISDIIQFYLAEIATGNLLIIKYRKGANQKILKIYSDFDDEDMNTLVTILRKSCANLEIKGLKQEDVLKMMGIKSISSVKLILITIILMTATTTIFFLPQFIHMADRGMMEIEAADLISNPKPNTRNLIVHGTTIPGCIAVVEKEHKGYNKTTKYYIPIVPNNWDGQPVSIVAVFESWDDFINSTGHTNPEAASIFRGILRNVLWEGWTDKNYKSIKDVCNVELKDDILLFELTPADGSKIPIFTYFLIISVIVEVTIIAVLFTIYKVYKKSGRPVTI